MRTKRSAVDHVAAMAALGEAVVALVKDAGVLRKKPGRKPGRRPRRPRAVAERAAAPRRGRGRSKRPAPRPMPVDELSA